MVFGRYQEFLGYSKYYGIGACHSQALNSFTLNLNSNRLNIELKIEGIGAKVKDFTDNKFYIVGRFSGKNSSFSFQVSNVDIDNWMVDEKVINLYIGLVVSKSDFFVNNMDDIVEYEISFVNYI